MTAAFARSRQIYLEMASLRMEIRALSQELASTRDIEQRVALHNRRALLELAWESALGRHRDAVTEGMKSLHRRMGDPWEH